MCFELIIIYFALIKHIFAIKMGIFIVSKISIIFYLILEARVRGVVQSQLSVARVIRKK